MDAQGITVAVLGGCPSDPGYMDNINTLNTEFERLAADGRGSSGKNCRGTHANLSRGVSFSGGQKQPADIKQKDRKDTAAFEHLIGTAGARWMSGFQGSRSYYGLHPCLLTYV